jgi:endonuclease/exonuclease/phosphatase (EEP) superfamily protein YafD
LKLSPRGRKIRSVTARATLTVRLRVAARERWREGLFGALAGATATLALLTLAAVALGRTPVVELATHFRVQYAAAAVVCALGLALLRSRAALAVALACAGVNVVALAPYLRVSGRVVSADAPATRVRLMLSNVYLGNRDYEALVGVVADERPDVLVLEELTGDWWKNVDAVRAAYPYSCALPRPGGSGIAIFSRLPVDEIEILTFGATTQPGMIARLEVAGRPFTVLAMHPPTPMRADKFRARNAQFAEAAERIRAVEGPKVLVGDLNSSPWSPFYQDLVRDSGLHDPRVGAGVLTTWPMPMPSLLRIPIDHCLTSDGVRVASIRAGARTGSDHRPIVVDLDVLADER